MATWLLLAFACLSLAQNPSRKILVYFGAGGEPRHSGPSSFDKSFENALRFSKEKGWNGDFYYVPELAGGASKAREIVGKLPGEFSKRAFQDKMDQIQKDILSGSIRRNDQILLIIDSHGTFMNDKTYVTAIDGNFEPLKQLLPLFKVAERRGVRVAVMGLSCHSGAIIQLAQHGACAISSTSWNRLGFLWDHEWMTRALRESSNMEEAFLVGRLKYGVVESQPIISTPIGLDIHSRFFVLQNFMDRVEQLAEKRKYKCLASDDGVVPELDVARDIPVRQLLNYVSFFDREFLNEKIRKYLALEFQFMGCQWNEARPLYCTKRGQEKFDVCTRLEANLIIDTAVAFETALKSAIRDERVQEEFWRDQTDSLLALRADPEFERRRKLYVSYMELFNKLASETQAIVTWERTHYDRIYRDRIRKKISSSNPCRDFPL